MTSTLRLAMETLQESYNVSILGNKPELRFLEALDKLKDLETLLRSLVVPCPICEQRASNRGISIPSLTVEFDEEIGEAGVVLSSWPVFQGTCADEPFRWIEERYDPLGKQMGYSQHRQTILNHGDILNREIEDGEWTPNVARAMGILFERKQVARLLGLEVR